MKKLISLMLVALMIIALAGCTQNSRDNTDSKADSSSPESALALLNSVWKKYADDEKFAVAGGDFSEENANTKGPGKYSLDDAQAVEYALGYPAASIDKIDDAASLVHMMNANSFTCAAYHAKDASKTDEIAGDIKSAIGTRQWICGFPEKLFIATVSDYVVAVYGSTDLLDVFTAKLAEVYPDAKTVSDDPIE